MTTPEEVDAAAATEAFGYAASFALATAIAERAGDDALRAVWADAASGVGAYQPGSGLGAPATEPETPGAPETTGGAADWRALLDLLEAHTGTDFTDLWRESVVRPEEAATARRAGRRAPVVRADARPRRRLGAACVDPRRAPRMGLRDRRAADGRCPHGARAARRARDDGHQRRHRPAGRDADPVRGRQARRRVRPCRGRAQRDGHDRGRRRGADLRRPTR